MQGDGNHGIEPFVARQCIRQKIPQWTSESPNAPVLVQVDQFPETALIGAETIGRVKTAKAAAAQSAAAFGVQREAVLKWGAATTAEEFRIEWLRFAQTTTANWNPCDFVEWQAANPAIVGKN